MKAQSIAIWTGVVILVMIGLVFIVIRANVLAGSSPGQLDTFDIRYVQHRVITILHISAGCFFFLLSPLQFSTRLRSRHLAIHRWSGRLLVACGTLFALTGLIFGILWPFGGPIEATAIVVFGLFFLFALAKAVVSIRRRDVSSHREWMIRMFAVGLGVSVIRIVVVSLTAATHGFSPEIFGLSFWLGWSISLGVAELWIRHTRPALHTFVTLPSRQQ